MDQTNPATPVPPCAPLLVAAPLVTTQAALFAQLRDDLGESAALCETRLEVFDG